MSILGGGGGVKSAVYPATPTFVIVPQFDALWVAGAPAAATNAVLGIFALFQQNITPRFNTKIVLNIGWGECNGSVIPTPGGASQPVSLAGSYTYQQVKSALIANAITPSAVSAVNSLPNTDPCPSGDSGPNNISMMAPQERIMGLQPAVNTSGAPDGYIGFSTTGWDYGGGPTISGNDFCGTVMHEVTECMGRSIVAGQAFGPQLLDYYRFTGSGVRSFGPPPNTSYFSVDNGVTNLRNYNTGGAGGDIGDWSGAQGNDSFNATGNSNVLNPMSVPDQQLIQALGFPTLVNMNWVTSGI